MRRFFILLALLFLLIVLAQEQTDTSTEETTDTEQTTEESVEQSPEEKRIIRIDFSGGTEEGDLRYGPLNYAHPEPEGIVGTVSNLTIYGQTAVLSGPEGEEIPLTDAEGRRTAIFSGGLRVTRNRLEAKGPDLSYSEETGIGSMTGNVAIVVAPEEEGDDPVNITAESADFDVDVNVSISRGNVQLENGNQTGTANEIVYEEDREIAKMTPIEGEQVTLTRVDDEGNELTITADLIRPSTGDKKLHAIGNVTVVDGDIISKGNEVFFNDEESTAEIIGNPATYDDGEGNQVSSGRILQFTDTDDYELLDETVPSEFNADDFKLLTELEPSESQ